MEARISRGYQEIAHTADWALKVWAPNLPDLLVEAARGMTELLDIEFDGTKSVHRQIELNSEDAESLLVAFLSELLFFGESERIAFSQAQLSLLDFQLSGELVLCRIKSQRKEIKAVTYHNLVIRETEKGLETVIVFDV